MYAITANSFRAIDDLADAQAGETVVGDLPEELLGALVAAEVRQQRDQLLFASDWTQGNDSPLTTAQKSAWAVYRSALRDLPLQEGFPAAVTWPVAP